MHRFNVPLVKFGILLIFALPLCEVYNLRAVSATDCEPHQVQPASNGSVGKKLALLIAISKYELSPDSPPNLHSQADAQAIRDALVTQFKFRTEDITVLEKPEQTTHKSISAAFQRLVDDTRPGDIVYVHFSGHGSEWPDPTHRKLTGMSQAIVPSDYDSNRTPDGNQITDLELNHFISELAKKDPAIVTCSFDCCHASGNTRSRFACRGFDYKPPKPEPNTHIASSEKNTTPVALNKLGNVVILYACRTDQRAWETDTDDKKQMGCFSYALAKALKETKPNTTYRSLFERIEEVMADKDSVGQSPQIEGAIKNLVMSGTALPTRHSFEVIRTKDGKLSLSEGSLEDMSVGSKFDLYNENETTFSKPIGHAEIAEIELNSSILKDESAGGGLPQLRSYRAIETEHLYNGAQLKVLVHCSNQSDQKAVADALSELKGAEVLVGIDSSTHWQVRVDDTTDSGVITAFRDNAVKIYPGHSAPKDVVSELKDAIDGEIRWRYVNELENKSQSSPISIQVRAVPVSKIDRNTNPPRVLEPAIVDSDDYQLAAGHVWKEGEPFVLEVKNAGKKKAYITVLNLQQDGGLAVIYPEENAEQELLPADGHWTRIPTNETAEIYEVQKPGADIVKVIGTAEKADFRPLEVVRSEEVRDSRAITNPLEQLFLLGSRDRTIRPRVKPSSWSTSSVVIDSTERKAGAERGETGRF